MDSGRVGRVVQNAAGAAHPDGVGLAGAGTAIPRSDVPAAVHLLIITTVKSDIALLSPIWGPRVADEPIALAIF